MSIRPSARCVRSRVYQGLNATSGRGLPPPARSVSGGGPGYRGYGPVNETMPVPEVPDAVSAAITLKDEVPVTWL